MSKPPRKPTRDANVVPLPRSRRFRLGRVEIIKAAVACLSGTLLFLSCATFDIWPLAWVAVAPLFAVVLHPTTERPAAYGFLCGLFANGGGFYWIVPFLGRFGHLPLIASIPIFLLLVSYQALTFTFFAWSVRRLCDRFDAGVTFIAPVVYVALELVLPAIFPWYLAITQAWVRPVIQIADLTGPLGVSFMLILANGALYDGVYAWRKRLPLPTRRLALAFGLVAATLGYGAVRIHQVSARRAAAPKLKVGVVQANIGISEKWRPELAAQHLEIHQSLSRSLEARGAELIVWPESSYPYLFNRDQAHDWPEGHRYRAQVGFHTPLLFGTLTAGQGLPYPYNSALLLDGEGSVRGSFDKNILMVFGEYIPFYEQLKFIQRWIPETSNWARGTDVSIFPLERPSGIVRIAPMICYEDIFPSFGRRLVPHEPNLLINITNDAWFGRTSEPYEHLALAVYRAVETRLDLVRAVNTGVSAFVDSTGKVYARQPSVDPDEAPGAPPLTLLEEVAVQEPRHFYARLGEWFGGLCLVVTALLGLRARTLGGRPVRWPLVAVGALALFGVTVAVATLWCGPSRLGLALSLLLHRSTGADADTNFAVGVRLLPSVVLGCLAAGVALARAARAGRGEPGARLEAVLAVLAVLVVPAALLGTLEGEQAGLVIGAILAMGLVRAADRLYRRLFVRA